MHQINFKHFVLNTSVKYDTKTLMNDSEYIHLILIMKGRFIDT